MRAYVFKRLVLVVPTVLVVLLINFVVVQFAPGGPLEQAIQQAQQFQLHTDGMQYQGQQGLSAEMLEVLQIQYGFHEPWYIRFWHMLSQYAVLDLGQSLFKGEAVSTLIWQRMPVTLSLGLWSTLMIYCIAIPLGIQKAKHHGSGFDRVSSVLFAFAYAVPAFVMAILLLTVFAGGAYWQWFPMQGLVSENFAALSWWQQLQDYLWHMTLPILAMSLVGLASLSYLTKSAVLEQLNQHYVRTATVKGLSDQRILYVHVMRNAVLVLIAGLPEALLGMLFMGNLLIEIIFNLDGIGLLGYEAILQRDYPIIFGVLFIFTVLGVFLRLLSDVLYRVLDPRIDFNGRHGRTS